MARRPAPALSAPALSALSLSALAWLLFGAVVAWTVGFLAGVVVPRTVDGPVRTATPAAVVCDLGLLLLFALQHSVMARPVAKAWMRRWVPERIERAVYVLAADACLLLLLVCWQPFGGTVWHVGGAVAVLVWTAYAGGWVLAIVSTFAVGHFELTGLRQAGWLPARDHDGLEVRGLHAVVRHPLMTGLLLVFWATPSMGAAHLLLAVGVTGYVALGVHFEERDLRCTFGAAYDDYAARVPAVVPGLRPRHREVRPAGPGQRGSDDKGRPASASSTHRT